MSGLKNITNQHGVSWDAVGVLLWWRWEVFVLGRRVFWGYAYDLDAAVSQAAWWTSAASLQVKRGQRLPTA